MILAGLSFFSVGCTNPLSEKKASVVEDSFHPGITLSLTTSEVTLSSPSVASGDTVTVSLQLKDNNGSNFVGSHEISFSLTGGTSTGTFGQVVKGASGLYTAIFTGVTAGSATTVGALVDGISVTSSLPTITVSSGELSLAHSAVSVSSSTIASGASTTVSLALRDSANNSISTSGLSVAFAHSGGTSSGVFSTVTDHNNGIYTANFTGNLSGTATVISAQIGGQPVTSTMPSVTVVAGNNSLAQSTVAVGSASINSSSATTVTLTVRDAQGNQLSTGGLSVGFSHSGGASTGSFSAVTDHNNGTYSATFTGALAGSATTIHAQIGGQEVTSTLPSITVNPGPVSVSQSIVSTSASSLFVGTSITVTLTLKDANNNLLGASAGTAVFSISGGTSAGNFSAVTDHGDGTYSALFTGSAGGTAVNVNASLNSSAITSVLPSVTVITNLAITSVSPTSTFLMGGKTLTINGAGFISGISVSVGGASCTSVNLVSSTQLTCLNPLRSTAGQVNITLTNTNTQTATLTNGFEYRSDMYESIQLFSGNLTFYGPGDGIGTSVRFNLPMKIVNYNNDDFYIADSMNHTIRKYNKTSGVVSTPLGVTGYSGSDDGVGNAAKFNAPIGLQIIGSNMYVADSYNCTIRKVDLSTYSVTTVAGVVGSCANANDPVGTNANLLNPSALTTDGTDLYVVVGTFSGGNGLRKVALSGTNPVTTVVNAANGIGDILFDSNSIYYTSQDSGIYRLDLGDLSSTLLAGSASSGYIQDGIGGNAYFTFPGGLLKINNDLYIADPGNRAIRKLDLLTNSVTTIAGMRTGTPGTETGVKGNTDGIGQSAKLAQITTMALDSSSGTNELYFVSMTYNNLRKINLSTQQVTTIVGKVGE